MSNPGDIDQTPIESIEQLYAVFSCGEKSSDAWRIGTEHEKFGFVLPEDTSGRASFSPPEYDDRGIRDILEGFAQSKTSWNAITDHENLIGLSGVGAVEGQAISLEPAGQFELSGAPLRTLDETKNEMTEHFDMLRPFAERNGLGFSPLGFHPTALRAEMPMMPKSRYAIMRRYMPQVGSRGLDMMTRTCTVQVNVDFSSEADMARKMRVGLALQPFATGFFANSPFYEGRANGYLSNRALVWLDTDNRRSGMPLHFFNESFGYATYVEWLLDVPMYFILRNGEMLDVAGCSFRQWLQGDTQDRLKSFRPTIGDFNDHLTTAFPDVRLKQFLEMRGADAGSPSMMLAQSALWVGLLYDAPTLFAAEKLVKEQPWSAYDDFRVHVPKAGFNAAFPGGARAMAKRIVMLAEDGLRARKLGEEQYLAPLHAIADGAPTQAEHWLERMRTAWQGDVTRIFAESAI